MGTCEALWNSLLPLYEKAPSTEGEWRGVSNQFERLWNFHTVLVPLFYGKHIFVQTPANCGSNNYNYKSTYSTINFLIAVCDADYRFSF